MPAVRHHRLPEEVPVRPLHPEPARKERLNPGRGHGDPDGLRDLLCLRGILPLPQPPLLPDRGAAGGTRHPAGAQPLEKQQVVMMGPKGRIAPEAVRPVVNLCYFPMSKDHPGQAPGRGLSPSWERHLLQPDVAPLRPQLRHPGATAQDHRQHLGLLPPGNGGRKSSVIHDECYGTYTTWPRPSGSPSPSSRSIFSNT